MNAARTQMPLKVVNNSKVTMDVRDVQVGEIFEMNNVQFIRIETLRTAAVAGGAVVDNALAVCLEDGKLLNLQDGVEDKFPVVVHLSATLTVEN